MIKAIKKVELETKKSSKGTEYTVCNVTLANGAVHQADGFIAKETMDLINAIGKDKVKLDYVEEISKNGNKYNAIAVTIPDIDFKQVLFLKRPTIALINLLSK